MKLEKGGNDNEKLGADKLIKLILPIIGMGILIGVVIGLVIYLSSKNSPNVSTDSESKVTVPSAMEISEEDDSQDLDETLNKVSENGDDSLSDNTSLDADEKMADEKSSVSDSDVQKDSGIPIDEVKALIAPRDVNAAPEKVVEHANGRYEIVEDDCSWTTARKKCEEMGGHLLTIDDYDEYAEVVKFIIDQKMDSYIYYLGGIRRDDEKYYWVDSEGSRIKDVVLNNDKAWCAGAWAISEPSYKDNHDNEENRIAMYYNSGEGRFVWMDIVDNLPDMVESYIGRVAFICEYDY